MKTWPLCSILLVGLVSCTVPEASAPAPATSIQTTALWSFEAAARSLRKQSCPTGSLRKAPLGISGAASPVDLHDTGAGGHLPNGVIFAGGWSLSSNNVNFGGLSGLETLPDGDLLTVSDIGSFVWIGMADRQPDGSGHLAYMLGPDGNQFGSKSDGDAEGLTIMAGVALVSFERNHRVAAFDLADCGAAARAARVARLPFQFSGKPIDENQGAEALSISSTGVLKFGLESRSAGPSPLGAVLATGEGVLTGEMAPNPNGYALVGMDETEDQRGHPVTVTLYRSYDPIRGNRNIVTWSTSTLQIELKRPMLVDNFEGVAAEFINSDTMRIWLISDNNFSAGQQTLLYAFDVDVTAE